MQIPSLILFLSMRLESLYDHERQRRRMLEFKETKQIVNAVVKIQDPRHTLDTGRLPLALVENRAEVLDSL